MKRPLLEQLFYSTHRNTHTHTGTHTHTYRHPWLDSDHQDLKTTTQQPEHHSDDNTFFVHLLIPLAGSAAPCQPAGGVEVHSPASLLPEGSLSSKDTRLREEETNRNVVVSRWASGGPAGYF